MHTNALDEEHAQRLQSFSRYIPLYCDNSSVMCISKNPIQIRTKHIDIYHHFVKEPVEERTLSLEFMPTKENLLIFSPRP